MAPADPQRTTTQLVVVGEVSGIGRRNRLAVPPRQLGQFDSLQSFATRAGKIQKNLTRQEGAKKKATGLSSFVFVLRIMTGLLWLLSCQKRLGRLISLSDKRISLAELGQALARHGVELVSTGGTARRCANTAVGVRHCRAHRFSRDDGRARQDAPPQGPWRPARRARQSRSCGGDGRARHRRDRPGRRQPLPVPEHRRERCRPRRDHREYRHRRPVDGALGRQEPRFCRDRHRPGRLCRAARGVDAAAAPRWLSGKKFAARAFAATAAYDR